MLKLTKSYGRTYSNYRKALLLKIKYFSKKSSKNFVKNLPINFSIFLKFKIEYTSTIKCVFDLHWILFIFNKVK